MEIKFDKIEHTLVVHIIGDIDHHTAEIIRLKCNKQLRLYQCKNIIFNMQQVCFMDSSGIGMIIGRYKEIEIFGGVVVAVGVSEALERIFQLSGLYKIIKCYKNLEEAMYAIKYEELPKGGLA